MPQVSKFTKPNKLQLQEQGSQASWSVSKLYILTLFLSRLTWRPKNNNHLLLFVPSTGLQTNILQDDGKPYAGAIL